MPEETKPTPVATPTPNTVSTNKPGLNWLHILIGVVVGGLLVGVGGLAYNFYQPKAEESSTDTSTKTATSSSTVETTPKDETGDWKTYTGGVFAASLKVPPNWQVEEQEGVVLEGVNSNRSIILKEDALGIRISVTQNFFGGFSGICEVETLKKNTLIDKNYATQHYFYSATGEGEDCSKPTDPTQTHIYLKSVNGNDYMIAATWKITDYKESSALVSQILNSLQLP